MDTLSRERARKRPARLATRASLSWAALTLFGVLALAAAPTFAACDNTDYNSKIDTYYAPDCLPPNADVRKRVAEQRKRFFADITADTYISKALEAVASLKATVKSHANENSDLRPSFDKLDAYLNATEQRLRVLPSVDTLAINPGAYPELLPDFWRVDSQPRDEGGGLAPTLLQSAGCGNVAPPNEACDAAFKRAIVVADDVYVATNLIQVRIPAMTDT